MPRWLEDPDWSPIGRSLRVYESGNEIVVEAIVAGIPAEDVEAFETRPQQVKAAAKKK